MKKSRNGLFFGIILVCAAVALILDGLGISISGAQISAWSIVGGVLCLAWLVVEIVELKFSHIFFPLAFIFLLFEGQIATWLGHDDPNLISNWLVLLAALLLTIGVGVLGGNLKKRKKTASPRQRYNIKSQVHHYYYPFLLPAYTQERQSSSFPEAVSRYLRHIPD